MAGLFWSHFQATKCLLSVNIWLAESIIHLKSLYVCEAGAACACVEKDSHAEGLWKSTSKGLTMKCTTCNLQPKEKNRVRRRNKAPQVQLDSAPAPNLPKNKQGQLCMRHSVNDKPCTIEEIYCKKLLMRKWYAGNCVWCGTVKDKLAWGQRNALHRFELRGCAHPFQLPEYQMDRVNVIQM